VELTFATFIRSDEEHNDFTRAAEMAGIPVMRISESGALDHKVVPAMRSLVATQDPDLIQTHSYKSHCLVRISRLYLQARWIAFHHGYTKTDLKDVLYSQLDRASLPKAHHVVTVCEPFARELERRGVPKKNISVVHNSVSSPAPLPPEERQNLRESLGIPPTSRVLLSIGRLSREKGHADLVRAVARVQRSLEVVLVMVGEGKEAASLDKLAKELGIAAKVILTGHRNDVNAFYSIADLFVLPSHSEGSPNVLLEAMAAGRPIVTTDVGGVMELVTKDSANVVPPKDPNALATAIVTLLRTPSVLDSMSTAAKKRALDFSRESYDRELTMVYQQTLAERE
jgi:glycosyltransferase involved in cell wall biosynthesis